jgi:hypothetical protein
MKFLFRGIFFILILLLAYPSIGQIRFYFQYEGIPLFDGGAWDFNVQSGIKISPDKEVLLGLGLIGNFSPKDFSGDIKFSKSSFSLGFNYYLNRQFYLTFNVTANLLNDIIMAYSYSVEELKNKFLIDYQIYINFIVLRRFHLSFGTGVIDFSNLVINTLRDAIIETRIQPNISLSLKLYVFQIKI